MPGYGQFCPVAKTMEILDERWTVLIVRELLSGSHYFNDLRRGVPRMSPTLLSKRLRSLVRDGLVMRDDDGNRARYELTPAGRELGPIVMALGDWGVRWMPELGDEDLDPRLLMWDIHRNINHAAVPDGRTVLAFSFTDTPPSTRHWWILVKGGDVDVCDFDPGFQIAVSVTCTLRTMAQIWRGDLSWQAALKDDSLQLDGPQTARRALPHWLKLSPFAQTPRLAAAGSGAQSA